MIAVDTSALMAVILGEETADACISILQAEPWILISAGTVAEALIVATRRGVLNEMIRTLDNADFETIDVTDATARRIGAIYAKWGRGFHPAALNYGDCFSYELATRRACPLLYVGADFSRTDVVSAL
jgi:ribonuclease VapC